MSGFENPHEVGMSKCSHEGCENEFKAHAWGAIKASSKGWFLQKNGDKWCPDHTPEWLAAWRAKQGGADNGN